MKTIIEFATEKNCSRQTVYNAIKRGELDTASQYGKVLLRDTAKNKNWLPVENKKRQ
jgi:predicted DNA-binding protein YlxM (UPF0122 family)